MARITDLITDPLDRNWSIAGAVLAGVVTWLSLSPAGDVPPPFAHADKLVHFCMYSALGGWFGSFLRPASTSLLLLLAGYGLGMELGQEFVPGRGFDWLDIVANSAGALAGILFSRHIWNPLQWLHRKLTRQ